MDIQVFMSVKKSLRATKEGTALLVVDLQGKLLTMTLNWEQALKNTIKAVKMAKIYGLPIIWTEQYPKGLGPTHPALQKELEGVEMIDKVHFSCLGKEGFTEMLREKGIKNLLVVGTETHICVMQTCLEALERD